MAKLGDMVCTTPVFRAIKKTYPNSKLYVIGNFVNKEVVSGNTDVDGYIVYSNNFKETRSFLEKENIDFAAITSPSTEMLALLYLSGIKTIVAPVIQNGYNPYETKSYKIIRSLVIKKPHTMGTYAPREYLRLLGPIGICEEDTTKHLVYSSTAKEKVENFMKDHGVDASSDFIVCISPSAGNDIKKWPAERFAILADYIYKNYNTKIIITGGENDKKEATGMISCINPNTKFIDTTCLFNIEELKALISSVNLLISVDTGPIYIAEAFEVPTIDIIGPIDEKEQPPIGKKHRIVMAPNRKRPELYVMNARTCDELEARKQALDITVDMVVKEFDRLFSILKIQ